jgi:hypothetical protein
MRVSDWKHPEGIWDLCLARYIEALDVVEAALRGDPVPSGTDLPNEMRIIRMVGMHQVPWYGQAVDHADSSVTVGVVLRNAFEALGDYIDVPTDRGLETRPLQSLHSFTRRNLPRWREGKREYNEWLGTLWMERPPDAG